MKRRRILLLPALAAVVMGIVLFWPRGPREPVVEGRRFTDWAKAAMRNSTLPDERVCKALRASAADAVPYLLHEFTRPPSKCRATWNRWASEIPLVDFHIQQDEERIRIALWGLYLLG